ncbi:MAG: serine/threonine protein kinase, partial [Planctomycetia bacterium]
MPKIVRPVIFDLDLRESLSNLEKLASRKLSSIKKAWINDAVYRNLVLSIMEEIKGMEIFFTKRKELVVLNPGDLQDFIPEKVSETFKTLQSEFRFPLVKMIGRGGTGDVWQSRAPGDIPVAIKMVPLVQSLAFKEKRSLELFCKIRHPHIIPVLGHWVENGTLWVEMELADCNLLQWYERQNLDGSRLSVFKLLHYFGQAAEAIDYLNLRKHTLPDGECKYLQHGDIKLTNLLMVGDCLKVADFGLGRSLALDGETQHSGSYTAIYAPPEFFDGKAHSNSDQYSLAICYARLRAGKFPFQGSMLDIMHGHCFEEPDLGDLPEMEKQVLV